MDPRTQATMGRPHPKNGAGSPDPHGTIPRTHHRTPGGLLMDLDAKFTWSELLALASNRNEWRTRVKALRSGASMQKPPRKPTPTTKHHYNTRSKIKTTPPTDSITSPTVRTPTATTSDNTTRQKRAKPSATMYPLRDAHEAFFRPNKDSGKRKCQVNRPRRKKRKKTSLTDKQRAAAQRDYYDRHHAPRSDHSEDITTTPHLLFAQPPPSPGPHRRYSVTTNTKTTSTPR